MENNVNLRVPGPTPVPPRVAAAGARPMVNHRGPEFAAVVGEIVENLKPYFGTEAEPLLLTGSGTGALEATVVNMLSPGDPVLAVTIGVFGNRFADIAAAFGADVRRVEAIWGQAMTPETVSDALTAQPDIRAVLITHNETSTGVTNDVASLARVVREAAPDALILVDGISSIGALPFRMDEWDVDAAITGSQKAWMSPPGAAMVAVSERGWAANRRARIPRYYWDFERARKSAARRTMPYTPAVGVMTALGEALHLMHEEGVEAIFARHRHIGNLARSGIANLGLQLFPPEAVASNTVTAARVPDGVDASALLSELRQRHGVVLGSGQDILKGTIFRIGHMGYVGEADIEHVIERLGLALDEQRRRSA